MSTTRSVAPRLAAAVRRRRRRLLRLRLVRRPGPAAAAAPARPTRSCILLWMNGGPARWTRSTSSPATPTAAPSRRSPPACPASRSASTCPSSPSSRTTWPIIRSMSTKEGDHGRATFLLRTGYLPQGPIQYPSLGALLSKELGDERSELPNFVSIAPFRILNPAAYRLRLPRPAVRPAGRRRASRRGQEQNNADRGPSSRGPDAARGRSARTAPTPGSTCSGRCSATSWRATPALPALSHRSAYDRAVRLMRTPAAKAFDLTEEKARSATPTAATCSARAACWPGGWSSAACRSSRSRSTVGTRTATTSTPSAT